MNIEKIKNIIQSCNVNFLIGSGLSKPYLITLGEIESWLTELEKRRAEINEKQYSIVRASIYRTYFYSVIFPNLDREIIKNQADFTTTLNNYKELGLRLNDIILHRNNTLLTKQINLFTTNIDLFFEKSLEETRLEFNDGFKGRLMPVFDLSNFQKSYSKTSLHYDNTSEIPVFNLLKIHGSINWKKEKGNNIVHCGPITKNLNPIGRAIRKIDENLFITTEKGKDEEVVTLEVLIERAKKIVLKETDVFKVFFETYESLVIVNPTKAKFEETLLEEQYYEMMRIYANSLEKVNTVLFVMGFSFADEHIKNITIRAANSNPTLQIIVFSHSDDAKKKIKINLGDWKNENILILSPTLFVESNGLEKMEKEDLRKRIVQFDCSTINKEIFSKLSNMIRTTSGK